MTASADGPPHTRHGPAVRVSDRVLVAIDDDLRLGEVAGLLERGGVTVDVLDDPYGAEERVRVLPKHQVVLLDVLLPTHEVYRLCRRLRAWTDVPMVIATWEDRPGPGVDSVDRLVAHSSTAAELATDVLALLARATTSAGLTDWPAAVPAGELEASPAPGGQM